MNTFDSLTHSMTTIATGGFSNYNESIGFFNSYYYRSFSNDFYNFRKFTFYSYIKFLSGNKNIFFSDIQIKTFLKIIFISIIILSIYLIINNSIQLNLRSIFFNVISILTGTGYVNAQFDSWGGFPLILIFRINVYRRMCRFDNMWY